MILEDPRIYSRHNPERTEEIPAIPKYGSWSPPPYWHNLLHQEETKFERICKAWFMKILFVLLILYILAIIFIYLFKLLVLVITLK